MATLRARPIGALLFTTSLVGCTMPAMRASPELVARSELQGSSPRGRVGLFNEAFELGPYRIQNVDRDWATEASVTAPPGFSYSTTNSRARTGGFTFEFVTSEEIVTGVCETWSAIEREATTYRVRAAETVVAYRLVCSCSSGGRIDLVRAVDRFGLSGRLSQYDRVFTVHEVHETEGDAPGWGQTLGFAFDAVEGPIGAVQVLSPSRVWLKADLAAADKADLSCLAAGLILTPPPPLE